MRRTQGIAALILALVSAGIVTVAEADDESVWWVEASGLQSTRILARLQESLSRSNPDAVIEWCPIVLRAVTDEHHRHSDRYGAACRVQDGVAPRRMLLCDDATGERFHFEIDEQAEERTALLAFINAHCPDAD